MSSSPTELELAEKADKLANSPTGGALALLLKAEDQILSESLSIIGDALSFAEVEPGQNASNEAPSEWLERYGYDRKRAQVAWRVANYAMLPKKDAPFGLGLAERVAVGILDAKAKQGRVHTMNVLAIQMNGAVQASIPTFEEIIVDDEAARRG